MSLSIFTKNKASKNYHKIPLTLFSIGAVHAKTNDSAEEMFSHNESSLFVAKEHVPVVPVKPAVLNAFSSISAGVASGTAVHHVTAAHRIRIWTAAPCSSRHPAAGLSIWTAGVFITWDVSVL